MNERSIFVEALEKVDASEQAAYLEAVCREDDALRRRVEKLLAAHKSAGGILDRPAVPEDVTGAYAPIEGPGMVIGPYKLMEQIGEGGMGLVFVAEQQQPVRRKVALKVIKPGMDTRQIVARFEAERQALALMDHPNIAKVLDGGETASGRPYFVMELVKGVPITDFCDQDQIPVRERLEMYLNVCQAVQHAHQKGIIHRDIKPSNVLVMSNDGTPVVKVIDFGVAKAIGQQLTDKTIYTQFTQLVGTPLYTSPEQAGQSGVDVDTRSDIYSLGVVLFELLTGTTPFDRERLKDANFDEIRRIIREEEPPKPSTRISTLGQAATTISTQRNSDPKRLSQSFRGELDWIVMKCLEKDRNRRYETASALAADIQHYLHDEPVQACPPSAWYRFRKFTRRKKAALAIAACVFFALAGIAGTVGWMMRDRAAREDALNEAVQRTLDETGPLIDEGKWAEALAVVERADKLLAAAGRTESPARLLELRKELTMAEHLDEIYRQSILIVSPRHAVQAQPQYFFEEERFWGREQDAEFAKAFRDFEIDVDALPPTEAAAQITRRSTRNALIRALDQWVAVRRRDHGESDPGWKKLVDIARQADPDPWRNRCREALLTHDRQALEQLADEVPIRQVPPATLCLLGMTLKEVGALDKAMGLLRRAQQQYPDDLWLNHTLGYFSSTAFQPPRLDDALRFYTVVSALRPRFAPIHMVLGNTLMNKGAPDEAMTEYTRAIELDPENIVYWQGRGWNYLWRLHQHDKAIADLSKAIDMYPEWVQALTDRAVAYIALRQYDKAFADLNKSIELDPKIAQAWKIRGHAFASLGQWDKAIKDFSKCIEVNSEEPEAWYARALVRLRLGDRAGYRKACADMRKHFGLSTNPEAVYLTMWTCIQVHDGVDDWTQVAQWAEKTLDADPDFLTAFGAVLYRAGRFEDAARRLSEAEAAFQKAVHSAKIAYAWLFLAMAHERQGHAEQSREWLAKAVREIDQPPPERAARSWSRELTLRLLRSEAQALIGRADKKTPQKDPKETEKTP